MIFERFLEGLGEQVGFQNAAGRWGKTYLEQGKTYLEQGEMHLECQEQLN